MNSKGTARENIDFFPESLAMQEPFQKLFEFFAAWFPDADLEGLNDQEITDKFVTTISNDERVRIAKQCRELMLLPAIPLGVIARAAWRTFEDQATCREWLESIHRSLCRSQK
jgi:hypothetical protein